MRKLIGLILSLSSATALAVGTSRWTHTSEADFKSGKFDGVVATNLGDLKLSRAVRSLLGSDPRVSAVYAMAQAPSGTIYAATGPQGVLLKIDGEKVESAATFADNSNLTALLVDASGKVFVGQSGEKGQVFRIDSPGAKPVEVFSSDDVQYVWSLQQTPDGNIYIATGPNGQLFELKPNGNTRTVLDCNENNLVSLLSDGKELLYVGTDPNGLVYRVNRNSGDVFVLYDAAETEVSALAMDAGGNLYAGTAQSTEPVTEGGGASGSEKSGRPEQDTVTVPLPSEVPGKPEPPKLPPNPAEPDPIPTEAPKSPRAMAGMKRAAYLMLQPDAPTAEPADAEPIGPGATPLHGGEPGAGGNAIYRIDPEGFVTEIFRQNVRVYSILDQNGALLVATGSEGMVYQVNPGTDETVVLAKVDPKEVMCLLSAKDGRVFMGLANSGDISAMSSGFAQKGTFLSPVLDASQISRFGRVHLRGELPKGTLLTVASRSGNVQETTDAGWSNWSVETPASQFVQINTPAARFYQYRLTFTSDASKGTPVVDEVTVAYQMPNVPPQVRSVTVVNAKTEGSSANATISWEAADLNSDLLRYSLYYRANTSGPWMLLKDKVSEASYEWNTRSVSDGRYQVKVVASDASANPPSEGRSASRVSDPMVVDNTPPMIGDLKQSVASGAVKIEARIVDQVTTIASLEYSIDSGVEWQSVLPGDRLADSPEEMYSFSVGGLAAGAHQIALRATDAHGNQSHGVVSATIP